MISGRQQETSLSGLDALSLLEEAADWRKQGRRVALATVTQTWGSSPRPAGSMLAVDENCHMIGSVSGGCVEGAVVEVALNVIADGVAQSLEFGVSNDQAWGVGLACGGTVRVVVERFSEPGDALQVDTVRQLVDRVRGRKEPVALGMRLPPGERMLVRPGMEGDLQQAAVRALGSDNSVIVVSQGEEWFLQAFNPPLRLIVVGAVHVAQVLVPMAASLGYRVTVVDPRRAFATEARFPEVELVHSWPGKALEALQPDPRTAVVTLTHDPKLDEPALVSALNSNAFYVGALGSRKTHAQRIGRLREQGVDDARLERIHAPIGLDIGARSPAEIAVSIVAEITQALRRGAGQP
jgi:xanthine dehydrogenase accessory factor